MTGILIINIDNEVELNYAVLTYVLRFILTFQYIF